MHYLNSLIRFTTDEAQSIRFEYLLLNKEVYLITEVAASTHNSTSFFVITTIWEFIDCIIKTLLAITARKISSALSQPIKCLWILKLYLSSCIQFIIHHISFLSKLAQQLSSLIIKRCRVTHIFQVPHVELVCVVNFAKEISVQVPEHAIVVPNDATFVVGTATEDFFGCLRDTSFAFCSQHVATAKGKPICLLVLVLACRANTKTRWRGLVLC